jgi:hypothetical protein
VKAETDNKKTKTKNTNKESRPASKRKIVESSSDEDCIEPELQNTDECEDTEDEISGSELEKEIGSEDTENGDFLLV